MTSKGQLRVDHRGRAPCDVDFTEEGQYLVGKLRTSFSALKLEPPSVGWGSIALVKTLLFFTSVCKRP